MRVLWGAQGVVGRCFDVMALWRRRRDDVTGRALDCGHYIAEERPEPLYQEIRQHFGQPDDRPAGASAQCDSRAPGRRWIPDEEVEVGAGVGLLTWST